MLSCLLYIFSTYWVTASFQLTIKEIDIPSHVARGSTAYLSCKVETRGIHQLRSIKWYKDDIELCRFTPHEEPNVSSFSNPGLADSIHCRNDSVEMRNVSILASGLYKCEASSESPTFRTVMNSRNISVMVYPTRDPVITGLRPTYYKGENIEAKCSSSPSNPPPKLRWFLNGIATNRFISNDIIEAVDPEGLYKRSQELRLIAQPELFTGVDRRLTLVCESTLPGLPPWQALAKVTLRQAALRSDHDGEPTRQSPSSSATTTGSQACGSNEKCRMKNRGNDNELSSLMIMALAITTYFARHILHLPIC